MAPLVDLPPDEIELWVYNGDVNQNLTEERRLVFDLADLQMHDLRSIPEIPISAGDTGEAQIQLKEYDWWGGYDQLGTQIVGIPDGEIKTLVFDNSPWNDTKYELRYRVHHGQVSTIVDSGPSGLVNTDTATFEFHATAPYVKFEGSLDGGKWEPVTSPKTYSGLADGEHTFRVRAVDLGGSIFAETARNWTVETTEPTVTGVVPTDGATGVSRNANVEATFSEAMDPATLTDPSTHTSTSVQLFKGTSTTPVAATVTVSADGKTVTLDPSSGLAERKRYTVKIIGAEDLADNTLPDYTSTFKTGRR